MSAYIVGQDLIRYLVSAAPALSRGDHFRWYYSGNGKELRCGDAEHAAVVGQMLWSENVRSVSARYPDSVVDNSLPGHVDDGPSYIYEHRTWRDPVFNPVQVLKAAQCLEYQSCEHDGWEDSEAHCFLQALRSECIHRLPGYEEATWGAPEERTDRISLLSLLPPRKRT